MGNFRSLLGADLIVFVKFIIPCWSLILLALYQDYDIEPTSPLIRFSRFAIDEKVLVSNVKNGSYLDVFFDVSTMHLDINALTTPVSGEANNIPSPIIGNSENIFKDISISDLLAQWSTDKMERKGPLNSDFLRLDTGRQLLNIDELKEEMAKVYEEYKLNSRLDNGIEQRSNTIIAPVLRP